MTEPVPITDRQKIALHRKRERISRAKASPLNRDGPMPFLEGEAIPYSEELMDALYEDYWENDLSKLRRDDPEKNAKARTTQKKHPVTSNRISRQQSLEDRAPELRRYPSEEMDDGGNVTRYDPHEAGAYQAYRDEIVETLPMVEGDDYDDAELLHIARASIYWRSKVDSGQRQPGGGMHIALMDCEWRAEVDDPFGRQLSRLLYRMPTTSSHIVRPRHRKEEAAALGISERTWRRRRAAMRTEQAAA